MTTVQQIKWHSKFLWLKKLQLQDTNSSKTTRSDTKSYQLKKNKELKYLCRSTWEARKYKYDMDAYRFISLKISASCSNSK